MIVKIAILYKRKHFYGVSSVYKIVFVLGRLRLLVCDTVLHKTVLPSHRFHVLGARSLSITQVELLHIFRTIVFVSVVSAIGASPLSIGVFLLASSRRRNALLSITLRWRLEKIYLAASPLFLECTILLGKRPYEKPMTHQSMKGTLYPVTFKKLVSSKTISLYSRSCGTSLAC